MYKKSYGNCHRISVNWYMKWRLMLKHQLAKLFWWFILKLLKWTCRLANVCVRQLLDTMIGMMVMYLFIHNSLSDKLGAHIITWAYVREEKLFSGSKLQSEVIVICLESSKWQFFNINLERKNQDVIKVILIKRLS